MFLGYISCKDCKEEHPLSSSEDAPVDKRKLGNLVCPKSVKTLGLNIVGEAQVNFQSSYSSPFEKCFSTTCKAHNRESFVLTSNMEMGCSKCLSGKDESVKIVQIQDLNEALRESSLLPSCQSICRTQASNAIKHLRKIEADNVGTHLKAQKVKLQSFFDKIHRSLELRENEALLKIRLRYGRCEDEAQIRSYPGPHDRFTMG